MKDRIIIIGASITGAYTAIELIKNGFDGHITLIDKKDVFPYNTYPLSKDWMQDAEKVDPPLLKKKSYYEKNGIDLKLNTKVDSVNWKDKTVTTNQNETIPYDKLVIATGSKLRIIKLDGDDANGVFYLREFRDAQKIKNWVKDAKDITIIGSGFMGLELSSTFNQLGKNVRVLVKEGRPLENILGREVSDYFVNMHESHNTKFMFDEETEKINKDSKGNVTSILTKTGKTIKTDMVIVSVGVIPNLPFELDVKMENGCIVINKYGETSLDDIYAGGDIVKWPYKDHLIHVEHWENAWSQGASIAKNIINKESSEYNVYPYFWTDQYDQSFEYLGNTRSWDKTFLRGSLQDGKFAVSYVDADNHPLAILFVNKFENRNDVESILNKKEALDPKRFADLSIPLSEV